MPNQPPTEQAISILEIAAKLGLSSADIECFGSEKAKFNRSAINRLMRMPKRGKVILVTAMTPTKMGEGKTTVAIGLADALAFRGYKALAALRQPSMGPVFGQKGGATGGGKARIVPSADINLHFTGDFHAIAAANNLLAAMVDNHIFHGNELGIDDSSIAFKRVLDVNDRALRDITVTTGNGSQKAQRHTAFDITAASEVMAALCLSTSIADLRSRLSKIVVARTFSDAPVTAGDIGAANAMCAILADAFRPNIVQTLEGTPVLLHGGPFANIAHGCSSIQATLLAVRLAEFVVTEAGFGADLGFEKYCDIVAAQQPEALAPAAVVIVATIQALKHHGGISASALRERNDQALAVGMQNLIQHVETVSQTNTPFVIALNVHPGDLPQEVEIVLTACSSKQYPAAAVDVWNNGGQGALELAEKIINESAHNRQFTAFYSVDLPVLEKLNALASKVYRASGIELAAPAKEKLSWLERHGYGQLPVCVAKTQYSFSDNPKLLNAPTNFKMTVTDLHLSAGAGFVVAHMGEISTMPGLPAHPKAMLIDVDDNGVISNIS
jgi:formate--tetrahydrofolate ligase